MTLYMIELIHPNTATNIMQLLGYGLSWNISLLITSNTSQRLNNRSNKKTSHPI